MPTLRSARAISTNEVELITSEPDSFLPINLTNLFIVSPTHWEAKLAAVPASVTDPASARSRPGRPSPADPSGTGPFRGTRLVPRERFEMVANRDYWDPSAPTEDRPRGAAAPAGGECPHRGPASAARSTGSRRRRPTPWPRSTAAASRMYQNAQPHVWPWQFSFAEGSPWLDKRVRHAANLCVNRTELKKLLERADGRCPRAPSRPAIPGTATRASSISYDPAAGKTLMREAGFGPQRRLSR